MIISRGLELERWQVPGNARTLVVQCYRVLSISSAEEIEKGEVRGETTVSRQLLQSHPAQW
ncbi:hypothetical protein V1478_002862 [Vespula squamosa]|uniref:Uncharacterized protein n=1 Tax=Vespula squamosa TaxID=30214 RepID=A0ABD2BR13_VESSQ